MIPARVEKRNRPPKSCEPCRIRKLKCNRGLPCDTCLKRGKLVTCQYAANANRAELRPDSHDPLRQRLKHLEDLVSSMAQNDTSNFPTPSNLSSSGSSVQEGRTMATQGSSQSPREDAEALGHGSFRGKNAGYADSSHWSSVLDMIKTIREELSPPNTQVSPRTGETLIQHDAKPSVDLGLASTRTLGLPSILERLPSREICDNLVTQYFRLENIILPVIHPHKFQREYTEFWKEPADASPLWIALLFAILSLSSNLYTSMHQGRESDTAIPSAEPLSLMAEQCLLLGEYVLGQEHSLEALLIHLHGLYLRAKESDLKLWFLTGALIRLAISKGYHRDPLKLSNASISPLESEMRRRIWICIFQADALMSFQMGLPSMIPSEYCDSGLPRNLTYSDFGELTTVIPESRPFSDYTPISYANVKTPIMTMFKKVVGHTRGLGPSSYDKTLSLDREIRAVYDQVPVNFKYKPLRDSIFECAGILMNRATVELLHLKSIIILHRQYVTASQDPRYNFSRGACVDAARCILDRQAELFEATKPNDPLHEERFMILSIVTHDFILAAMVLCLDLTIKSQRPVNSENFGRSEASRSYSRFGSSLAALRQARHAWTSAMPYSSEAKLAMQALDSTIRRIESLNTVQCSAKVSDSMQEHTTCARSNSTGGRCSTEETLETSGNMYQVNWGLLDDTLDEDFDLESWILDSSTLYPSERL